VPTRKAPVAQVKAHRRELIDPKIEEHRGRIVKTTGDGILIEDLGSNCDISGRRDQNLEAGANPGWIAGRDPTVF
jgi:hypothetical protein